MTTIQNNVCLVTGATRGIGKGVALKLGEKGAIVYITGRTLKPKGDAVGGSLEETAAEINARGGKAHPVVVDHSKESETIELFERIRREQRGRLDVVVNNAFSAVSAISHNIHRAYFEIDSCTPGEYWDVINNVGLRNYYICATLATRMMLEYREHNSSAPPGLIVNISSFGGKCRAFSVAYGCGKTAVDRMMRDMAIELKRKKANICAISLWPGIVRTEEFIHRAASSPNGEISRFIKSSLSESPELTGAAVAAIASENPSRLLARSGDITLVCDVAQQYNLREHDGRAPPHYRSLQTLLRLANSRFAWLVPSFIRVPKCIFFWILGRQ